LVSHLQCNSAEIDMPICEIHVQVSLRWWLRPYLWSLMWFCVLFNTEPDDAKISYWIGKGIKTDIITRKPATRE